MRTEATDFAFAKKKHEVPTVEEKQTYCNRSRSAADSRNIVSFTHEPDPTRPDAERYRDSQNDDNEDEWHGIAAT